MGLQGFEMKSFDDLYLSESDKLDFLNLPVVKNNLANCWFDDQELIMPSGQGRTLKAVVYSALEVFKITIASRKDEINKLEVEIKETQAFLNNQNHIKQAKIDELQKRINFLEVELKTSNDAIALKSTYKVTWEKGNKDD